MANKSAGASPDGSENELALVKSLHPDPNFAEL